MTASSIGTLQFQFQFHSFSLLRSKWVSKQVVFSPNILKLRRDLVASQFHNLKTWNSQFFYFRALKNDSLDSTNHQQQTDDATSKGVGDSLESSVNPISKFHSSIETLTPILFMVKRYGWSNFVIWVFVATAILVLAVRAYVVRKSTNNRPGSVADLVRRGQLHSHSRGISRPLKYEDPFNNPLVKVRKGNSAVEMCGKVYRLAPVTLTEEQQAIHQKRRSRAYQWKRPTVFLKEGDSIPPDVDPDTVRWIPANHPFATTASEIDEDLAQNNVYQQHGVPFRIRAEHEALQRKLETLQQEQKLSNLYIDTGNAKDFERPFKKNPATNESVEQNPIDHHVDESMPNSDSARSSFSEDRKKS